MITANEIESVDRIGHRFYQRSFLLYFVLVLISFAGLSLAFYQLNRTFLQDYIQELNQQQIRSTASILDSVFYRVSYASAAVSARNSVMEYLSRMPEDESTVLERTISDLLSLFVQANTEISSANVYSVLRDRMVTETLSVDRSRYKDSVWIDYLQEMAHTRPILVFRLSPIFEVPMLSVIRRIDSNGEMLGGVVFNLEIDGIRSLLGRREQRGAEGLYILQDGAQVVFSLSDSDLGSADTAFLRDSGDSLFMANASGNLFNLDYYLNSGLSLFQERTRRLRRVLFTVLGAMFVIGAMLSVILASIAYRPIRRILGTIQHPESHIGDVERHTPDEIRYIEESIIRMIATNRQLEERLAERFRSLRRAHYKTLQLQINPHFLYNTLESIYWSTVEVYRSDDPVPQSVSALSRFLRKVLMIDAIAMPLHEEIELTNLYLEIVQFRFPGVLKVEWDVQDRARRCLVPKLLLQPLIENAFYHGIKPTRKPGNVYIQIEEEAEVLQIRVSDDGRGMKSEVLEELRRRLAVEEDIEDEHIGLLNVNRRVRLLFGTGAEILLHNASPSGTTVLVRIPSFTSLDKIG